MPQINPNIGFHDQTAVGRTQQATEFTYAFENFFHPFVGELISKLNQDSLPGMLAGQLDPALNQESLFFESAYSKPDDKLVKWKSFPKRIDVDEDKCYANYNWELFFHIPFTVGVHLSKTH